MTVLLDANVLIALVVTDHVHHDAAANWFSRRESSFATCPTTEASLVRFLVRNGQTPATARDVVARVSTTEGHDFWADDLSFKDVHWDGVIGHRQVTDAYLAQLARSRGGRLATLDRGLAHLHSDVAVAVPIAGI